MSKAWDNNILKKLKALVGKGLSTAEIGKKLGLSKNAVVGKLHRMGWNAGAADSDAKTTKPVKKTETKKVAPKKADKKVPISPVKKANVVVHKPVKAKPAPKEKTVAKPVPKKTVGHAIAGKGISVHQRMVQHALEMANLKPNQCRWPIGDPDSENFHFCGQPVFVGKPYCYEHCKQAYQFTPPKKK
jgi:GcrA cell cycle regulator